MKNIKLFSALALAVFAVNVAGATTSAVAVDASGKATATTDGKIGFQENKTLVNPPGVDPSDPNPPKPKPTDPTDPDVDYVVDPPAASDLALTIYPGEMDFGIHDVDASVLYDSTVQAYPVIADAKVLDANGDYARGNGVQVYDGRLSDHDWSLTVGLDADAFGEISGGLKGGTITFENASTAVTKAASDKVKLGADFNSGKLTIGAGDTKRFFAADKQAKTFSMLHWKKPSDVNFNIAGTQIKTGNFTATLTWTLSAVAEA